MDKSQKIELILIFLVLVFSVLFFVFVNNQNMLSGFFLFESNSQILNAPFDFINEDDISIYDNKIVIEIENYTLSRYDSSKSMIPILSEGATGIGIRPKSEKDIHIGDIVSFKQGNDLIVHRVVEKGIDREGVFFITKGDNNDIDDGKIRFSQIDSVLVAIIY